MKRGMTLLEVLLALVLLASLVVATTSWTTMAATFGTRLERAANQQIAAESVLRFMHDCIVTGDFEKKAKSKAPRPVHIDDADGALVIHTRVRGEEITLRFTHNADTQQITANDKVILDSVIGANWIIDDEQRSLTVELVLQEGTSFSRRYVLP